MGMIGANLEGLAALAAKFQSSGAEFDGRSRDIMNRLGDAIAAFQEQMNSLKSDADVLADEMKSEMDRLKAQADSTVWTGAHRVTHDQIVVAYETDITGVRSAVVGFSGEAKSVVDGQLSTVVTGMQTSVGKYGAAALQAAGQFNAAVVSQRNAIDQVMNG